MRRIRHPSRGRAATLFLALLGGCAYYSEELLRGGEGGTGGGGSAGEGGSSAGAVHQAGRGGSAGAPPATAGSSSPSGGKESEGGGGGVPAATGGVNDSEDGGSGGEPAVDDCPEDPEKTQPGECGCGIPESCAPLKAALLHRYRFAGSGSVAVDSIGDADGTLIGVTASQGKVTFAGGSTAAYVDLPNGIISALDDASFEIWLEWSGGASWQRIFDFGSNDVAEGSQGVGKTYLYLTPRDGSETSGYPLRASFSLNGTSAETTVKTSAPLPTTGVQHIVLVVDETNAQLRLYRQGELAALTGFNGSLSTLDDVNNWLGRSNYKDPHLGGSIEEFRIYGEALTDAQVAASSAFGPNPPFL